MGRFDRRNSRKMLQRRAKAAKKQRLLKHGQAVREARVAAAPPKKRGSKASS